MQEIVFNSTMIEACIEISTFNDSLVEPIEFFQVCLSSSDIAFLSEGKATIAVTDVANDTVVFTLANDFYSVFEGEMVAVCIQTSSNLSNVLRNVTIQFQTSDISAGGMMIQSGKSNSYWMV